MLSSALAPNPHWVPVAFPSLSQAFPRCDNLKCLRTLPNVPWGKERGRISQAENNWPRGRAQTARSKLGGAAQSALLLPAAPEKRKVLCQRGEKGVFRGRWKSSGSSLWRTGEAHHWGKPHCLGVRNSFYSPRPEKQHLPSYGLFRKEHPKQPELEANTDGSLPKYS